MDDVASHALAAAAAAAAAAAMAAAFVAGAAKTATNPSAGWQQ
jgi:hypothetical protein